MPWRASGTGIDFKLKRMQLLREYAVKLRSWDTSGQERFATVTTACVAARGAVDAVSAAAPSAGHPSPPPHVPHRWVRHDRYFRYADVVLVVFDVSKRSTFTSVYGWHDRAAQHALPVVVVGNKTDRVADREVPQGEAQAFCDERALPYFEASAQSGEGVDRVFDAVARIAALKVDKRYKELGGTAHAVDMSQRQIPLRRAVATPTTATVRTFRTRSTVQVRYDSLCACVVAGCQLEKRRVYHV